MQNKNFYIMIAAAIILFFIYKFYIEFAANQKIIRRENANQQRFEDLAYMSELKGEDYEQWEIVANRILDPVNILGFR